MDEGQKATDSMRASLAFIPKARDSGAAFSTETARRWMDGCADDARGTDERTDRGRSRTTEDARGEEEKIVAFGRMNVRPHKGKNSAAETVAVHTELESCALQEERVQSFWEHQPKSITVIWQLLLFLTHPKVSCLKQD